MTASLDLQAALHEAFVTDDTLLILLGGPHVYDGPPPRTRYPFVTFGDAVVTDYGGTDAEAFEHRVELHAWTRTGGQSDANAIADALRDAIAGVPETLGDHRLANIHVGATRAVRLRDGITVRATLDVRAVTEPQ